MFTFLRSFSITTDADNGGIVLGIWHYTLLLDFLFCEVATWSSLYHRYCDEHYGQEKILCIGSMYSSYEFK